MSYRYGYPTPRRGKLSKAEKAKRAATRRRNRIQKEFTKNFELYDYDKIATSAEAARHYGFSVYWSICKSGHIGEFTLTGKCKTCQKVRRGIRDAKTRGSQGVKLTKKERKEIVAIYAHAKRMTAETGVEHHVDHIRPLAAGGEHHPSNLQVLTATENLAKGSTFSGKRRTYTKKEKREKTERLKAERLKQLDAMYEQRYLEELDKYEKLSWLRRLFTSKPIRITVHE